MHAFVHIFNPKVFLDKFSHKINSVMAGIVIEIWFLYDNGLRHERVNISTARSSNLDKIKEIRARTEQFKHSFFPFALMNGTSWIN